MTEPKEGEASFTTVYHAQNDRHTQLLEQLDQLVSHSFFGGMTSREIQLVLQLEIDLLDREEPEIKPE